MDRQMAFGSNLKYYREKRRLTQKQLAEKIGYTEKSVSKWENASGLPTLVTVLKLAELLGISLDELLFEKTSQYYFLGIDGGGTKTVFKLADENGTTLRTVLKEASNPNDIGMEKAKALLKEGIQEVCSGLPYARISLFAGISGGGLTGNNAEILREFFGKFGFYAFGNGSDIENLMTLADRNPCILVIMGTGFIVYALHGNERKRIAGWGQFFDEGGSGYTLGRDAISAVLRAADGSGEKTILTDILKARIGMTVQDHLPAIYEGGKRYVASFSGTVFEAAAQGDRVAKDILQKNMTFVAQMIDTAARNIPCEKPIPVLFSGSVSKQCDVLFPYIRQYLPDSQCILTRLESEPVDGALWRAKQIFAEKVGEKK